MGGNLKAIMLLVRLVGNDAYKWYRKVIDVFFTYTVGKFKVLGGNFF